MIALWMRERSHRCSINCFLILLKGGLNTDVYRQQNPSKLNTIIVVLASAESLALLLRGTCGRCGNRITYLKNEEVSGDYSRFEMTVEGSYAIAIATLSDKLKDLAPVFQPMRSLKLKF